MLVMVCGGASCGKSSFAERLVCEMGKDGALVYLATMRPYGPEAHARIERHRSQRANKGFATIECYGGYDSFDLDEAGVPGGPRTVLLECLANVVNNTLFDDDGAMREADEACLSMLAGIERIAAQCTNLVVVANEVGQDAVRYADHLLAYIDVCGRVACEVAARADVVVETVAGIPHVVKGSLDERSVVA